MYKITILLKDKEFEHDVFELTRAFFPDAGFTLLDEVPPESGPEEVRAMADPEPEIKKIRVTADREDGQYILALDTERGSIFRKAQRIPDPGDGTSVRKQNKDIVKSLLYGMLSEYTGKTLPWGNLTGIRPAKLATEMLENGKTPREAEEEMKSLYLVSEKKARLAVEIAEKERELLSRVDCGHGYSLYLGIPFCPSICLYCSFSSYPADLWKDRVDAYLCALEKEIRETSALMEETERVLNTVYIGGGTPTSLNAGQLERLLGILCDSFKTEFLMEFTVEAGRPDSITREKLETLKRFPVTRISVNPQTMNQKTLDLIGRKHTVEQTVSAFGLARETGFDNINMDLIIGLPGEEEEDVRRTLEQILALSPESMTVHSLAVKRAARLNLFKDRYREMTFENNQRIIDLTMHAAGAMNMAPYYMYRQKNMKGNFENVGYAEDGAECLYNVLIMEQKEPIIALGAGGSTKFQIPSGDRIERIENIKDVSGYIDRIDEMIERKRTGVRKWLVPTD